MMYSRSFDHVDYNGMVELFKFYTEELETAIELQNWLFDNSWDILDYGWLDVYENEANRMRVNVRAEARKYYWEYDSKDFDFHIDTKHEEIII